MFYNPLIWQKWGASSGKHSDVHTHTLTFWIHASISASSPPSAWPRPALTFYPPHHPLTLQPLLPNAVLLLVSFSLRPSCRDLNLLARLNWGDSSLNHHLLVVLPPFFIHFNHQTPVTRNIGPSVWNSPHKRKGRGHWCASHGRIAARIHLVPAETVVGDWWRRRRWDGGGPPPLIRVTINCSGSTGFRP